VPLGRWDFPQPVGYPVSAIDGSGDRVLVGTHGGGAFAYEADGSRTYFELPYAGSSQVNGVHYDAVRQRSWIVSNAGLLIEASGVGSFVPTIGFAAFGATRLNDVHGDARSNMFFSTQGGGVIGWFYDVRSTPHEMFSGSVLAGQSITTVDDDGQGRLWVAASNGKLYRVTYGTNGFGTPVDYGFRCNPAIMADDLVVTRSGERWIADNRVGNEFSNLGICRDLPGDGPTTSRPPLETGLVANDLSVDMDGRIWIAVGSQTGQSGGLRVYEVVNPAAAGQSGIRFDVFNWQNSPLGTTRLDSTQTVWNSSTSAIDGVEERVWAGRDFGELITVAQRWQQLDQSNALSHEVIQGVWTVAGRLFAATANRLHVLEPDGVTWQQRQNVSVKDVMSDSSGKIWVATSQGVRLYRPDGWDLLTDRIGTPPSGTVRALAEDSFGRVWIGGDSGLTLFDRNRFVVTLNDQIAPLPNGSITSLLVDRENRLWVGTGNGLARLELNSEGVQNSTIFRLPDGSPWLGLAGNAIHDLAALPDGTVVISTATGLSYYRAGVFQQDSSVPITPQNLPLSVDEVGRLWAGSAVRTLNGWRGYFETNSGLRSTNVSDNVADKAGRVWFSHAPDGGLSVRGAYLPPLTQEVVILSSFSPQSGSSGTRITIEGTGFGQSADEIEVSIGGVRLEVQRVTANTIEVVLTEKTTSGDVVVRRGDQTRRLSGFRAVPVISSITPTGGNAGVVVEIFGTNFDSGAMVSLGGGIFRALSLEPNQIKHNPLRIRAKILTGDGSGSVTVSNSPGYQSTFTLIPFRKIELNVQDLLLNQGIQSTGLVAGRPTVVQTFLQHSDAPRNIGVLNDRLEVDRVEVIVSNKDKTFDPRFFRLCPGDAETCTTVVPTRGGAISPADRADLSNTLNFTFTPSYDVGNHLFTVVQVRYWRRDQLVTEATTVQIFRENTPMRVLMVPIMRNGYSAADVTAIQSVVNPGLTELRRRMMPTGDVELIWSPISYAVEDVLTRIIGNARNIDIDSFLELYQASHNMERARRWWNANRDTKVHIGFGVVDDSIVTNGGGKAFWPDVSEMINDLALTTLDTLCDVADTVVNVLSLGFLGGDGCSLEVPLYVGWATHRGTNQSYLFGHEIGHIMGLVKPWAPNGTFAFPIAGFTDNLSHSLTDELDGGHRNSDPSGLTFNMFRTLYHQEGVRGGGPIVNPLNSTVLSVVIDASTRSRLTPLDQQLRPNFADGRNGVRAKAMMAYAFQQFNDNTFFEPVDVRAIYDTYATMTSRNFIRDLMNLPFAPTDIGDIPPETPFFGKTETNGKGEGGPLLPSGTRLFVSGSVNRVMGTGELVYVEPLTTQGPIDLSFETAYRLVQLDSMGNELQQTGVYPQFSVDHELPLDEGFFAATILRHPDATRLELRHEDQVLAVFQPGSSPPDVEIFQSPVGSYQPGDNVTLEWGISDADGDSLTMVVLYSPDDGQTWWPVAFPDAASGAVDIPVERLGNSPEGQARLRLVVSDGLIQDVATTDSFSVSGILPMPWIDSSIHDGKVLEGRPVLLHGGADDLLEGQIVGSNLRWSSDKDGHLGTGDSIQTFLSVGTHQVTLQAINATGETGQTTITLHVLPDYDGDGIPDHEELALGLNPLAQYDVFTDADGDGVPLIVELGWGTDPNLWDSDGDGRSDAQEIGEGTDPTLADDPLPAGQLLVSPTQINLEGDLARDVPLPQQQVFVAAQRVTDWVLSADVPWLAASRREGKTPDSVTILVNGFLLQDGVHTGNLRFDSSELEQSVTIPIEISITNTNSFYDVNGDGAVNEIDRQLIEDHLGLSYGQPGYNYRYDINRDGVIDSGDLLLAEIRLASIQPSVQASYIYYAASSFANSGIENALDNTKRLAKEGVEPVTLSYDNLINSSPGINGLVFDIRNLPGGPSGNLTAADFEFQMSPTGAFIEADHPPANWTVVPFPSSISVLPGSPDRVVIQWPNNAIANRWLRITVKATANTGLTEPEVYYIGHLLGETTGPSGGVYTVSFADITPIRSVVGQTVDASSIHDIDKNGTVSFADISAMRPNVGAQLTNITIPAANASSGGSGSEKLSSQQSGTGKSGGDSRRSSSLRQMPALPGSPSLLTNTARPLPSWSDALQTNPGPSDIKPVHRTGGIATRDQWLEGLDALLEDAPIVNYWSTERSEEDQEEWEELWISTISLSRKSPIDPPIQ
jgi:ligand-binding sensor domain-containing protein